MGCGASTASAPPAPQEKPVPARAAPEEAPKSAAQSAEAEVAVGTKAVFDVPETVQDMKLVPCGKCGRSFAPDRLAQHESICTKLNFNSALTERTKPGEGNAGGIGSAKDGGGASSKGGGDAAWRDQSNELRAAKAAAKKAGGGGGGDWEAVCVGGEPS